MILVVAAVNLMSLMNLNYRSENKADSAQSMDTSSEAAKQDTGAEDSAASGGDMGAEPKDSKDMAKQMRRLRRRNQRTKRRQRDILPGAATKSCMNKYIRRQKMPGRNGSRSGWRTPEVMWKSLAAAVLQK